VVEFLNLGELDEAVKNYDSVFIFFYAPWCGWCKKIKPVIERVGTYFNTKPDNKKTPRRQNRFHRQQQRRRHQIRNQSLSHIPLHTQQTPSTTSYRRS